MYGGGTAANTPAAAGGGGPNQRYNYLVGRLRNRQITMEEATELFALMQGMIARANDAARAAAYRAPTSPIAAAVGAPPPPPRPLGPASSADDFLLVGLLAMGAGAGLLAALSKRIGDVPPPSNDRPKSGAPSR